MYYNEYDMVKMGKMIMIVNMITEGPRHDFRSNFYCLCIIWFTRAS